MPDLTPQEGLPWEMLRSTPWPLRHRSEALGAPGTKVGLGLQGGNV